LLEKKSEHTGSHAKSNKSPAVAEMGDHLATIDMGQKLGAAVPLFGRGSWVPI